jgi:hypothetical protein
VQRKFSPSGSTPPLTARGCSTQTKPHRHTRIIPLRPKSVANSAAAKCTLKNREVCNKWVVQTIEPPELLIT